MCPSPPSSVPQAENKLAFVVQALNEVAALFQEDHSAAPWAKKTGDAFINVITQQAEGLGSCVSVGVPRSSRSSPVNTSV